MSSNQKIIERTIRHSQDKMNSETINLKEKVTNLLREIEAFEKGELGFPVLESELNHIKASMKAMTILNQTLEICGSLVDED